MAAERPPTRKDRPEAEHSALEIASHVRSFILLAEILLVYLTLADGKYFIDPCKSAGFPPY
jgi:hypothetical protein